MGRNKNKKPQPPPNQQRDSDRTGGSGRGGRGRGRGGRGSRGGGISGGGGADDPLRWRSGFRGGGPAPPNFRNSPPPFLPDYEFQRGRGRGRGGRMDRGRGFGALDSGRFAWDFNTGTRLTYQPMDEIDFETQQWNEPPQSGRNTPGSRGRGSPLKSNGNGTPRGRGGHGSRGGHAPKLPSTSSLSSLWYEERPMLRPIKFVRSVETATLFQEAEELLESTTQNTDENHVPTADRVSRVFSNTHPHLFDNSLFEIEEGIEEVNFEDLALVHEQVLNPASVPFGALAVQKEAFAGVIQDPAPEPETQLGGTPDETPVATEITIQTGTEVAATSDLELSDGRVTKVTTDIAQSIASVPMVVEAQATTATAEPDPATTSTESSLLFVIDTDPSTSQMQIPAPAYNVRSETTALGESAEVELEFDPEDDVIVYDAPNPRISTPKVELTALTKSPLPNGASPSTSRQVNPLRRNKFVHAVGRNARRGSSGITGIKRKRLTEHGSFATFGATVAEAGLRFEVNTKNKDPKEHLRRQGDSDLDWGGETDEEGEGPVVTAEGMDLDPDLVGSEVTLAAMERFVEGLNGNHVTMDDLEGVVPREDSPAEEAGEEGEEDEDEIEEDDEDVEGDEERMLIEEFFNVQDDPDFSDDEDEDDLDPRAGFQARLDRLRKKQQKMIERGVDEDNPEDEMDSGFEWGEGEDIDDFLGETLDKYEKNRVARNAISRVFQDGSFDELQPKASSSKRKDLPPELQAQWEKDRLKKAKRKSERELARLEAAFDPLATKKAGKKSKKAMIAAARLDPSIVIPRRSLDMDWVEQQIRRFLADQDKQDMTFPACDKGTRMKIHHLAPLFGLKSKSKDGALGRYTTLIKKRHSGRNIDEREVARMMQEFEFDPLYDVSDDNLDVGGKSKGRSKGKGKDKGKNPGKSRDKDDDKGKGKLKDKGQPGHLKTKEGDVVGHAAPKIDEANVGFVMLASMGWSDGATIGLSGGLDAPITAVIKKTKLGLGATVSTKF